VNNKISCELHLTTERKFKQMKINTFIIACAALILSINGMAQQLPEQLRSWFSSGELSKIKKADIRIDQGEQILFSQQLKNLGDSVPEEEKHYLNLSQKLFINKQKARLLLETKEYFASGFDAKLEIYKSYLDHFLNADSTNQYPTAQALNDSIDIYISDAHLFRDRSEVKGNLIAAANSINQSNINLQSAIKLSEKALLLIKEGESKTETRELVIQQIEDTKEDVKTIDQNNNVVDVVEAKKNNEVNVNTTNVTKTNANTITTEEPKAEKNIEEVYFTVQILADKKPVPNERIKAVYKGTLPVIENQGDGWYRYSIGKFSDYALAKKALLNSGVTGYVVAYKNKTRISVREAITYLQQNNQ